MLTTTDGAYIGDKVGARLVNEAAAPSHQVEGCDPAEAMVEVLEVSEGWTRLSGDAGKSSWTKSLRP